MDYKSYITSQEWRLKHPIFLKKAGYRCSMFPWLKVGRGRRYNCHHMHYRNLGDERYRRDIICLSPFAHNVIIHGLASGFKRPSQQKNYPNTAQKILHLWCVLPIVLKVLAVSGVIYVGTMFIHSQTPQQAVAQFKPNPHCAMPKFKKFCHK